MTAKLVFQEGFDWRRVAWGGPNSPARPLCAYCAGGLPEVPLMIWRKDGGCASFCDECVERWVTAK